MPFVYQVHLHLLLAVHFFYAAFFYIVIMDKGGDSLAYWQLNGPLAPENPMGRLFWLRLSFYVLVKLSVLQYFGMVLADGQPALQYAELYRVEVFIFAGLPPFLSG